MTIWIGSPTDIREGVAAQSALRETNDSRFLSPLGVVRVDRRRWEQAQDFERDTWLKHATYAESDRNDEHKAGFGGYEALPAFLGAVLEVGCGPFTQTATILQSGKTASGVALLDPLAGQYLKHPHCTYGPAHDGMLMGIPTRILPLQAEEFEKPESFDTIICINVLEHVQDAITVLSRISANLRTGGLLVFHERVWDDFDPNTLYDVGHPCRCRSSLLNPWLCGFESMHNKDYYFIGRKV